jgi:hypothetical protein
VIECPITFFSKSIFFWIQIKLIFTGYNIVSIIMLSKNK